MPMTRVKPRAKPQRRPAPPGLLLVGDTPVVLPEGKITPGAWPELAMVMLVEPVPRLLPDWLSRLEARLGVKPEHRQVLERRAFSAAQGKEDLRRRQVEESVRAAQLDAPIRDAEIVAATAKVQERLARARAAAENPPGQTDRERRKAAKVARAKIAQLTEELAVIARKEADQARLLGDARDSVLLAKNRGEEVPYGESQVGEWVRDEHGARVLKRVRGKGIGAQTYLQPVMAYSTALRAKRLTGIEHAKDAGYLGGWREAERLHKIGVDYREAYEAVEGQKGGEGEGGGSSGPKAPQPRQIELGQRLADMRRGLNPRQRNVLDRVCGQDMRLREAATVLRLGDPRTAERALVTGLNAADASRVEAVARREALGEGAVGKQVAAVSAALSRLRV
jgi:hypothetical protein